MLIVEETFKTLSFNFALLYSEYCEVSLIKYGLSLWKYQQIQTLNLPFILHFLFICSLTI